MNLAIYYHKPLYESRGGVGRVATWLARNLVAEGHRVWCFVPSGFRTEKVTHVGVSCDAVETIEIPKGSISAQHAFVLAKFRELGIAVVFNQCGIYKQSRVVLGCGARVITTHHSATDQYLFCGRIPYGTSFKHKLLRLLSRFSVSLAVKVYDRIMYRQLEVILEGSDVFTLLAQSYKDWMTKQFPQYCDKFHVISNPIPFEHAGLSDFSKTVLFVGRVAPVKRVDRLIEIWSRLPRRFVDWKLVIVGPGRALQKMRQLSAAKNLSNVEIVGRADVQDYYHHASIICLTSDVEGVPMVLREAMSFGIAPIIFNSFSAAKEMIDDHVNGRLIPAFDMEAYVQALAELMDGEAERMRGDIFESAKPFTGEKIFAQWKRFL